MGKSHQDDVASTELKTYQWMEFTIKCTLSTIYFLYLGQWEKKHIWLLNLTIKMSNKVR